MVMRNRSWGRRQPTRSSIASRASVSASLTQDTSDERVSRCSPYRRPNRRDLLAHLVLVASAAAHADWLAGDDANADGPPTAPTTTASPHPGTIEESGQHH
jgi:hypothetical protein